MVTSIVSGVSVEVVQQVDRCALVLRGEVLAALVQGPLEPDVTFNVIKSDSFTVLLSKRPLLDPTLGYLNPGDEVRVVQVLYPNMRSEKVNLVARCEKTPVHTPTTTYVPRRGTTTATTPTPQPTLNASIFIALGIIALGALIAIYIITRRR